jgi:hypothetical protein
MGSFRPLDKFLDMGSFRPLDKFLRKAVIFYAQ